MFDGLRRAVYKIISYKDIASAIGLDLPDNTVMDDHMQKWLLFMTGEAPYLYNKKRERKMKTLNLPMMVSNEYARMCLLEYETEIFGKSEGKKSSVGKNKDEKSTNSRSEWLQTMHDTLIYPQISHALQWALALGNVVFKPRYVKGKLQLGYVAYPNFIPVAWNDEGLTEVIFKTDITRGRHKYTLLEHCAYSNRVYSVKHYSFKGEISSTPGSDIGVPIPLEETPDWAGLKDFETAASFPWFVHIRTPKLNTVDPGSPLGVSVFAASADTIQAADEAYSALAWEMQAGKVRTMLPKDMFTRDKEGNIVNPDPEDNYYMLADTLSANGEHKPYQFAPTLRDESITRTIKHHMTMLEKQLAFSEGTFSEDNSKSRGVTATQIISDKIETLNTVTEVDDMVVKPAVKRLTDIFNEMADVLHIAAAGTGGYDISVEVNRTANIDPSERFNQAIELYHNSLLPGYYPLLYSSLQVTEEEAKELVAEAQKARQALPEEQSIKAQSWE